MTIMGGGILVAGMIVARAGCAQTVHPWGTSPCPPVGDTLSLLQPRDAAYADAPGFARFLRAHAFVVRCVTRTVDAGLLGVGRAAGFQTDKGPISVLFFAGADRVGVEEQKTPSGYRYTFHNPPHPGVGDVLDVNGPLYLVAHGGWFIVAPDARVAATLKRSLAGP